MKTLYVLFNGDYSDTHAVGVYSSRKKAERVAQIYANSAHIEEFSLNAMHADITAGKRCYFVRLSRETGDTQEAGIHESTYGATCTGVGEDIRQDLYTYVWAVDRETAVKIAGERRRSYLAQVQA
mgnify:FL=1